MEVSKLDDIRRKVVDSSCFFVLHTDVNVLVELIHDLKKLFNLLSSLLEAESLLFASFDCVDFG